jgi:CTP synthase (UTP-ammonia lyase)
MAREIVTNGIRYAREQRLPFLGTCRGFQHTILQHGRNVMRIAEIPDHPFFLATLFVPQMKSKPREPHPVVTGFCRAVVEHAALLV